MMKGKWNACIKAVLAILILLLLITGLSRFVDKGINVIAIGTDTHFVVIPFTGEGRRALQGTFSGEDIILEREDSETYKIVHYVSSTHARFLLREDGGSILGQEEEIGAYVHIRLFQVKDFTLGKRILLNALDYQCHESYGTFYQKN